jgi:cell division transport system permease protein
MSKASTVSRLKAITKQSSKHFFRNTSRIFKYGLIGFGRNIWLSITATIVTTLTLFLLAATVVAGVVLTNTADAMRAKIDITVYFKPELSDIDLASMANTMRKDSNVREVTYSNSEEMYEEMMRESDGQDDQNKVLTELIGKENVIKRMPSAMRIKVYDTDDLSSIKSIVNTNDEFIKNLNAEKEPSYDTKSTVITRISSWANIATGGGIALCILFLVISVLVVFNTIRMAIYSRSEEIYMEKLVGADNSFIRGPFLVEAMISGLLAGGFASAIGILAYSAIEPKLAHYEINVENINSILFDPGKATLVILLLIVVGIVITLTSSRLAIHKYLKRL